MSGHIVERGPNRWAIVLETRDANGKRKQRWHSFKGTKREARDYLAKLNTEMKEGRYIEPAKTTVSAFLERWLEHIRTQVSPKTSERYAEIVRNNIVPVLGSEPLAKLQPAQISSAYARARRRDGGALAPRSVHHMHRVLSQALQQAVLWRALPHNPATLVKPPKVERKAVATLTPQQAATLLGHLRHSRVYWPSMIALATGLRRGEILALRWKSVYLDRAVLHVVESIEQTKAAIRFKPPKNGKSRAVTLPAFAVLELRRLKREQAEELLKLGIRQSGDTLVCGRVDGEPHSPLSLTYEFARFMAGVKNLPRIRFHDLRHSHATQLLASGVHPKVAQERLGHSSIGITMDLYSHVTETMQEDAAKQVDAILGAALEIPGSKG
jgi:integrase